MTTRSALRGLFKWMTGPNKTGNPYMHKPVTDAILALTHGKSRLDQPTKRPRGKIEAALHDLVTLATVGDRHGNPYMKPEVRAASLALGGDGYDIGSSKPKSSHARKKKLTHHEAKQLLQSEGVRFGGDYHADVRSIGEGERIAEVAKMAGYRKSKGASGSTARMYFQYLSRLK